MRQDVKSSYSIVAVLAALSRAANTYNSTAVDHSSASSVSFLVTVGNVGTGGKVDGKLQYSNDNSNWTDYPDNDPAGNDDAITQITAAGSAVLHVVNPRGRYSRFVATVSTDACVFAVVSVLGPLRHVDAG